MSAATAREDALRAWCNETGCTYYLPVERDPRDPDATPPHIEAFLAGYDSGAAVASDALAWSQQRLRAFCHAADAEEVLGWYGLTYEEPKPVVRHA